MIKELRVISAVLTTVIVSTLLFGCSNQRTTEEGDDAHALFKELSETIKAYTDSMRNVKSDSTLVDQLSERYEKRIADISFKYRAGTDNLLSEGENDELFRLISIYTETRANAIKAPLPSDSIPAAVTDSVQGDHRE